MICYGLRSDCTPNGQVSGLRYVCIPISQVSDFLANTTEVEDMILKVSNPLFSVAKFDATLCLIQRSLSL